jgi:hypothetical protein
MKFWHIVLLLICSFAHGAEMRLVGLIDSSGLRIFGVCDERTGQSAWLRLNDHFMGYTLDQYDVATCTLTLSQSGTLTYLKLAPDKSLGIDADLRKAHALAERDVRLRTLLGRLYETRAALRAYEVGGRKGKPPVVFAGSADSNVYSAEAWIKAEVLKRVKETEDQDASK